jgi:threonyl-tRNA synthetase
LIRDATSTFAFFVYPVVTLHVYFSAQGEDISIYHIGEEWWDLCAGPHVETTKAIDPKALEIQRVSGMHPPKNVSKRVATILMCSF